MNIKTLFAQLLHAVFTFRVDIYSSDSIDESLTPAAVALIERRVEYNINQVKHTDPRGQRKERNLI